MDATDFGILKCLMRNARSSAKAIGGLIGLSTSAVIERIRKMEASKVILRYTVVVDTKRIGRDITAFMSVNLEHPKHNDGFRRRVSLRPDVVECFYMTGEYDYLLKIVTRNSDTLEDTLKYVKYITGVSRTLTLLVLDSVKSESVLLENSAD